MRASDSAPAGKVEGSDLGQCIFGQPVTYHVPTYGQESEGLFERKASGDIGALCSQGPSVNYFARVISK